ncbi:hypothetical protein CDAR_182021 [Caerostris darwini]|uniref:Uncharacterized protein n=1 Tax=Caerostris darwini TaxID=1538125 RepID=A0AAV4MVI4_9ARAC|nr:hypothetical protein CDAR_182021 [Caerostris darwini]
MHETRKQTLMIRLTINLKGADPEISILSIVLSAKRLQKEREREKICAGGREEKGREGRGDPKRGGFQMRELERGRAEDTEGRRFGCHSGWLSFLSVRLVPHYFDQ